MSAPDPKEVSEMARLIRMMNEGNTYEDSRDTESLNESFSSGSISDVDSDVSAMKNILEAFRGINTPEALTTRAINDRELREALITEPTDRGARIGSWEIVVNENEMGLKTFDVINVITNEPIATDLSLYDAAHGITRALNEGQMINSQHIRGILTAEYEYSRARQHAAEFREKARVYEHTGNPRLALMEDRYDEALGRAKAARNRVTKITNL